MINLIWNVTVQCHKPLDSSSHVSRCSKTAAMQIITKTAYLIKDPQTNSLILFNPRPFDHELFHHIKNIQDQSKTKLTHVVSNTIRKQIQPTKGIKILNPETCADLKPQVIGEMSICLIRADGYEKDFSLIGVTHMAQNSTKLPVLFLDGLMGVCKVDLESKCKPEDYMKTLAKVKYFPNQTFVFPSETVMEEDILFAKAIGVNPLIQRKLSMYEQNKKLQDCLIPTTVGEEKMLNPFFQPEKYSSLLGSVDRKKCFELLKGARREWKK